jgi:hypothetical protein
MPGFDAAACLLKTAAINELYATQVYATLRMANWLCDVMAQHPRLEGLELVETIAALPNENREVKRRHTSFSAKFCHFFVDEERYPIYDEAARDALRLHLQKSYNGATQRPYKVFCENVAALRKLSNLNCSGRELDRYLWITGMYRRLLRQKRRPKPTLNVELLRLFKMRGDAAQDLNEMLPAGLRRAQS